MTVFVLGCSRCIVPCNRFVGFLVIRGRSRVTSEASGVRSDNTGDGFHGHLNLGGCSLAFLRDVNHGKLGSCFDLFLGGGLSV